jgi:hypothetical protein
VQLMESGARPVTRTITGTSLTTRITTASGTIITIHPGTVTARRARVGPCRLHYRIQMLHNQQHQRVLLQLQSVRFQRTVECTSTLWDIYITARLTHRGAVTTWGSIPVQAFMSAPYGSARITPHLQTAVPNPS